MATVSFEFPAKAIFLEEPEAAAEAKAVWGLEEAAEEDEGGGSG